MYVCVVDAADRSSSNFTATTDAQRQRSRCYRSFEGRRWNLLAKSPYWSSEISRLLQAARAGPELHFARSCQGCFAKLATMLGLDHRPIGLYRCSSPHVGQRAIASPHGRRTAASLAAACVPARRAEHPEPTGHLSQAKA